MFSLMTLPSMSSSVARLPQRVNRQEASPAVKYSRESTSRKAQVGKDRQERTGKQEQASKPRQASTNKQVNRDGRAGQSRIMIGARRASSIYM